LLATPAAYISGKVTNIEKKGGGTDRAQNRDWHKEKGKEEVRPSRCWYKRSARCQGEDGRLFSSASNEAGTRI
jgi:hypothetical protein